MSLIKVIEYPRTWLHDNAPFDIKLDERLTCEIAYPAPQYDIGIRQHQIIIPLETDMLSRGSELLQLSKGRSCDGCNDVVLEALHGEEHGLPFFVGAESVFTTGLTVGLDFSIH